MGHLDRLAAVEPDGHVGLSLDGEGEDGATLGVLSGEVEGRVDSNVDALGVGQPGAGVVERGLGYGVVGWAVWSPILSFQLRVTMWQYEPGLSPSQEGEEHRVALVGVHELGVVLELAALACARASGRAGGPRTSFESAEAIVELADH